MPINVSGQMVDATTEDGDTVLIREMNGEDYDCGGRCGWTVLEN